MAVVARKKIVLSNHAKRRLKERRQDGVTEYDVYAACHKASEILVRGVPLSIKLEGFTSKEGVKFGIAVVDFEGNLLVTTVIGHKYERRRRHCYQDPYRMNHLPYKKQIKIMKKKKKEELKWKN